MIRWVILICRVVVAKDLITYSLSIDNLCDVPVRLVFLEVVGCLLRRALKPREVLWVLRAWEESRLVESVWHLYCEAAIFLCWVQRENEALWIVPLGVLGVAPLHELGAVESDLILRHQSCLANFLTNLEVSTNYESVLGQDELEWGRSVLAFNLRVLRWLLRNVNEGFAVVVKAINTGDTVSLELILVVEVVTESIFVVSVTDVHLESDAFINEHFVLAFTWQLETFVWEHDVPPDLWNFNLLHIEEFFGVIVLIPLESIKFTELESENEELVWILN